MRQTWLIRHANEQATMLAEAAAFLDRLVSYIEASDETREHWWYDEARAMAKKLRGET